MVQWNDLTTEIQDIIIAYYEQKLDVVGMIAVKNALTSACFDNAIDLVLDEITSRKRRQLVDEANTYNPTNEEIVGYIQAHIDAATPAPPEEPPEDPPE